MCPSKMKKQDLEHLEQVAFVEWFYKNFPTWIIFAVPNGHKRSVKEGIKIKAEGGLAGVPDLKILLPNGKSVMIEMKDLKGDLSPKQKDFIDKAETLGHTVLVGYGCTDASKKFIEYLKQIKL